MRWFCVFAILLVPYASAEYSYPLKNIQDVKTTPRSAECDRQMTQYVQGLGNAEAWAWNMFDASPKLPYGILIGNNFVFGNYDECMRVKYESPDGDRDVKGKFCLAGLVGFIPVNITMEEQLSTRRHKAALQNLLPVPFRLDSLISTKLNPLNNPRSGPILQGETGIRQQILSICIPDACKPSEVFDFLINSLGLSGADINLPIFPNDDSECQSEDTKEEFSNVDIAFVTFFAVIVFLNIVSSAYDAYCTKYNRKPVPLYLAFSLGRNFKILHENNENPNRITCLDGLRVFSILWVILGHRFSFSQALPWANNDYFELWKGRAYTMFAQGAASAVDSFLFLTGLLTAMLFIKTMSRPKAKFNIVLYYVHRYLRLTPALGVVYFLHVSLFVHAGDGPLWPSIVLHLRDKCIDRWASFFFYYQNYLDSNDMCLLHTWYLSMDMQMFIVSPLILIPLVKWRKFMIKIGMPVLLALSMICAFVITYVYETEIFQQDYYDYYYYPMHTRLSAWFVGIYTGTLLFEYRNAKLEISWLLNMFIWLVVIVAMICCVFLGNDVIYEYNRVNTAFYLTFHRPAWCVCLAWVVFACMKGRGGIFNYVLSIGLFQNLSKLTYSMYLVHITSLLLGIGKMRFPGNFDDFELIHLFLGDILQVVTIAIIWYLLFESPVAVLEKVLLHGGGKPKPPVQPNGEQKSGV